MGRSIILQDIDIIIIFRILVGISPLLCRQQYHLYHIDRRIKLMTQIGVSVYHIYDIHRNIDSGITIRVQIGVSSLSYRQASHFYDMGRSITFRIQIRVSSLACRQVYSLQDIYINITFMTQIGVSPLGYNMHSTFKIWLGLYPLGQ